jgi:chromosomal replication initiator protein
MYLAKELTSLSLVEIGGYFGGRDHSTVLYAVDKIRGLLTQDPTLAELVAQLRETISSR